ncbi:MAG TPA: hypothetical protein VLZ31_00140 [Microbacteriaceae bacterium]|nr:hypothetical protein [Microbacteriaceae bacterium]
MDDGATSLRIKIADATAINTIAIIGFIAVWNIYQHLWFFVVAGISLIVANAVAFLKIKFNIRFSVYLATLLVSYLVVAVLFAIPNVYSDPANSLPLILQVVLAPVAVWKQLITLDLPLGTYQAVLTPVVFVTLALVPQSLILLWSESKRLLLAIPLAWGILLFGISFGSSSITMLFGSFSLQLFLGLLAFFVTVVFLLLRDRLTRQQNVLGLNKTYTSAASKQKAIIGTLMLTVAFLVSALVSPSMIADATRDVLRTAADPTERVNAEISPLVHYRKFLSDEWFDETIFEIAAPAEINRVRLAVMQNYDGNTLTVTSKKEINKGTVDGVTQDIFKRVPATVSTCKSCLSDIKVEIKSWQEVWTPIFGVPEAIIFQGQNAHSLADNFYYHAESGTGVQLAEVSARQDMTYLLTTNDNYINEEQPDLRGFTPARESSRFATEIVPDSLKEWIKSQEVGAGAEALIELLERLRERGFLSHDFMLPSDETPLWVQQLNDYQFQSSRSGHSTERIDQLFSDLLKRESELQNVSSEPSNKNLVAATGDDEQFAVAAMLIADHLGFDVRVVFGVLLDPIDATTPYHCDEGVCDGSSLSVWIEVQDSQTQDWAALDVTPQWQNPPTLGTAEVSDPQNQTEVVKEKVGYVPPADPTPGVETNTSEEPTENAGNFEWLWEILVKVGVSITALLLFLSPIIIILAIKSLRRKKRKTARDPLTRIIGGWSEYVDREVDGGQHIPVNKTRLEIANSYRDAGSTPAQLAVLADMAEFSGVPTSDTRAEQYWQLVESAIDESTTKLSFWFRLKAKVSVRSFKRKRKQKHKPKK